MSNDDQRNLYNFLGADDYNVYKSQNSNFQNFFNSAFKIKNSFENSQKKFMEEASEMLFGEKSADKNKQMEKAFRELFEEESSSEEEEEEESKNVYSFYNHFSMSCNSQKNHHNTLFTHQSFQAQYNQKSFQEDSFSTNFTSYNHNFTSQKPEKNAKFVKNAKKEKNDKKIKPPMNFPQKAEKRGFDEILQRIKGKKPIFSILRNQIRKKSKRSHKG